MKDLNIKFGEIVLLTKHKVVLFQAFKNKYQMNRCRYFVYLKLIFSEKLLRI